jgi:outer membrane protein assembly factor BamB
MPDALARHDAVVRSAISKSGGYVFATGGDSFSAAFARPMEAVDTAIEIQSQLSAEDWGELGNLRVGVALHTGIADERDGDYFGPPVNRTARILSVADGGDVLISQTTLDLLRHHLQAAGLTTSDLGARRLKGIGVPERIHALDLGVKRRRSVSRRSLFTAGGLTLAALAVLIMVVVPPSLTPEEAPTTTSASTAGATETSTDSTTPDTASLAAGTVRWTRDLGAAPAGMVVDRGVIYAVTSTGNLVALNLERGEPVWEFDANGPLRQPPTVSGGVVYLVTISGNRLFGVAGGEAQLRCSFSFLEPGPVSVVDRTVYLGAGGSGTLYVVATSAGTECDSPVPAEYVSTRLQTITTAPVIAGDHIYLGDERGDVAALNLDDPDQRLWSQNYFTGAGEVPEYEGRVESVGVLEVIRVEASGQRTEITVLVTDAAGNLHFVDGGRPGRAQKDKVPVVGTPAVAEGRIYYLESLAVVVLDPDLEVDRRIPLDEQAALGPVLGDGVLYYVTRDAAVVAVDLDSGKPIMRQVLDSAAAVLTPIDDGVVAIDQDGTVSVVDLPAS